MRSSFFVLSMFALLSAGSMMNASDDGLRVPSLGAVYDPAGAVLRSISGVLGAAVLEPGVPPGFEIAQIGISNELRFALATSATDGLVRVVKTTAAGKAEPQIIAGTITAIDRIVLSPSGSAAMLHSSKLSLIQVLAGLPGNPVVKGEFSTVALGDAVAAAAVSDDGSEVLFPGGSLWRIDMRTASARVVGAAAAAVSFRERSHEGIAVSRTGDVYRLDDDTATYVGRVNHTHPVASRVSADGSRAYVAFADGALASLTFSAGDVKVLSCGCRPSGLDRVNSNVFRITADPSSALLFFDASQAEPRLRFVPAAEADLRERAQ
jgi:hypothetical protein